MSQFAEGNYRCVVAEQGFGESKEKQTPYFYLRVQPFALLHPGGEVAVDQVDRTIDNYLTEGTVDYVIKDLRAMGWTGTDFGELDPANSTHHSFVGQEVPARCEIETYNGKDRERWRLRFHQPERKSLAPEQVRKLNAMFGAKLKQAAPAAPSIVRPSANGVAVQSKPSIPAPVLADGGPDDIPF